MVLAVDIGNSNVVVGCFDKDWLLFVDRFATNRSATALEHALLIKTALDLGGYSSMRFEGSIISSVVPAVTNAMCAAIEKLTHTTPLLVGPGLKTGLMLKLENPSQLGSDRVADAVAATHTYAPPLIVIDMGTATTISVVDKTGAFIGGMIMPGLRLSTEALSSAASQLPQISLKQPERAIGRNTVDCMRSGIILGTASILDGVIDRIQDELGYPCTVISTGGNARLVTPNCRHTIHTDEDLLLKGLRILYYKNV